MEISLISCERILTLFYSLSEILDVLVSDS